MRKGYVIAIRDELRDAKEMEVYAGKVAPTLATAKPLVAYGRQEVLEGPESDGAVILEFESYDAAREWYESDAYSDAKLHRLKAADYRLIIVEGL